MNKHDRMAAACDARKAETGGKCAEEDCLHIGWCAHCFEMANAASRLHRAARATDADRISLYGASPFPFT